MKTSIQILAEANRTIAYMHNRPEMYIGSKSRVEAGELFDGMIWMAHKFWAFIQSKELEFREAVEKVRESHECGCLTFCGAFRFKNPEHDEESVFNHVQMCWAEVDAILGIDISEETFKKQKMASDHL